MTSIDFTGRMRVSDSHEREIANDPYSALYWEDSPMECAIAARCIAGFCHSGQSSALYAFASSGHLDIDGCLRELATLPDVDEACALAAFLRGLPS